MRKIILGGLISIAFALVLALPISLKSTSMPVDIYSGVTYVAEIETSSTEDETEPAEESKDFDWSQWFKDKCLPVIIAVGGAVVTVCTILCPILSTVNGGIKLFKGSKENFESVTNKVIESQQQITEFKESALCKIEEIKSEMQQEISNISQASEGKLSEISATMQETFDMFTKEIQELITQVENQIKVLKIAFGNDADLVKNGYANEIMKIGVDDGNKEVKEENNSDANS